MVNDFSQIASHPDREELITKILSGTSPKDLSQLLKLRYPNKDQSHLKLSVKLLKDFAESEYCNLDNQYIKDIQTVQDGGKLNKQLAESLMNNKTYKERLLEVADQELDVKKMLTGLIHVCQERTIQLFDLIQSKPESYKPDYVLLKYFETLLNMVEKFDRIINKSPDLIIQNNLSISTINDYTDILQNCVREILNEMDPNLAMEFLDKYYSKLKALNLPSTPAPLSSAEKLQQVSVLQEKVLNIDKP